MQIRRAGRSDLRQLCVTAMRAFAADPVMRWLYPDDDVYFETGGEVLRGTMTARLHRRLLHGSDDIDDLFQHADELVEQDLLALRFSIDESWAVHAANLDGCHSGWISEADPRSWRRDFIRFGPPWL